jgi:hypothetical protein
MSYANPILLWPILIICGCTVVGCGSKKEDTRFDEKKSVFEAIQKADKLVLYEGLPDEDDEREQLEEEKRNKKTVTLHGFSFYAAQLEVSEKDKKALQGLLGDDRSFSAWRGEKKCGGFHPDYAIAAVAKGEETTYLICFGCGEAKVYRPDRSETRYDLGHAEAMPQLSAILKPYHMNRPGPIKGP